MSDSNDDHIPEGLPPWKRVFREGFAPLLPRAGLEALRLALELDDPALLQGGTTMPPPLEAVADWPVEGACAVAYAAWWGLPEAERTVRRVEEDFGALCFTCDQALNEPAGCRFMLNWYDETPRAAMRQALLPEVERELRLRRAG